MREVVAVVLGRVVCRLLGHDSSFPCGPSPARARAQRKRATEFLFGPRTLPSAEVVAGGWAAALVSPSPVSVEFGFAVKAQRS